jgi:hypothetical protein
MMDREKLELDQSGLVLGPGGETFRICVDSVWLASRGQRVMRSLVLSLSALIARERCGMEFGR